LIGASGKLYLVRANWAMYLGHGPLGAGSKHFCFYFIWFFSFFGFLSGLF
jgi:hypothetical protein